MNGSGFRVGIGYDSHRLVAGRRLILGGIEIPFELGLDGHSDADALTHAITDAVLGAAGYDAEAIAALRKAGAIPANSIELLREVAARLDGRVANVDATVICERPKLGPYREEMERRLTDALASTVSVKATTNEGMGAIGRGEGIAVIAVALFEPNPGVSQ